jgi:hypothetical protein
MQGICRTALIQFSHKVRCKWGNKLKKRVIGVKEEEFEIIVIKFIRLYII